MSEAEKRKIYDKRKYLKRKILEKCKGYHDLGDIKITLTIQIGSNRDKKLSMQPKERVNNLPTQMVKESAKADLSVMCQQFVNIDPTIQEQIENLISWR